MKATPQFILSDGPIERSDLKKFVESVNITELDAANFGAVGLAVSQTEAPTELSRGTLWFKRGDGRLYLFDNTFYSDQSFDSAYSGDGRWVCMSDRKEILIRRQSRRLGGGNQDIAPVRPPLLHNLCSGYSGTLAARNILSAQVCGNQTDEAYKDFSYPPGFTGATIKASSYDYAVLVELGYGLMPLATGFAGPGPAVLSTTTYTALRADVAGGVYKPVNSFGHYVTESVASAVFSDVIGGLYEVFTFQQRPRSNVV